MFAFEWRWGTATLVVGAMLIVVPACRSMCFTSRMDDGRRFALWCFFFWAQKQTTCHPLFNIITSRKDIPRKGIGKNTLKTPWRYLKIAWKIPWKHPVENTLNFLTFSMFSLCTLGVCPLDPSKLHARNFSRCPSTVSWTVPSCEGATFRWILIWEPNFRSPRGPTKPKNRTNSTKEFSEQFEGVTGHYPVKQGFWGKSDQKVHPNVRQNLCHAVSLWYLACPQQLTMQLPKSSSKGNLFVRVRLGGVPSTVEEVVRVWLLCLLSWKTNTGSTGRTVLSPPALS